jgi:glycosyltransferase involved in cell wall biosynthesis
LKISVIIPTRNRADPLAPALYSLTRQTLDAAEFEILVIDNGSTDHTAEVVKRFSDSLPNLSYHYELQPGLQAGRHMGLRKARGELLVFSDDDIEALPIWLEAVAEGFNDPEVVMVGGNNLPMFVEPPPDWLQRLWERPALHGGKALPALSILELPGGIRTFSPFYVWGCNFAIRKSVLLAAGGFHPDGMPKELVRFRGDGETHVSRYVADSGLKCLFHPGASVYHKVTPERMTFAYLRQRGFNQGVSDSFTALRAEYLRDRLSKDSHGLPYRIIKWVYRKLKSLHIRDAEIQQAMKEMAAGHAEGYAYHQQAFKTDPEVRAWVLKESYL